MTSLPNGKTFTELEETLAPIRDTLEELAPKDERTWEEKIKPFLINTDGSHNKDGHNAVIQIVQDLLHTHTAALAEEAARKIETRPCLEPTPESFKIFRHEAAAIIRSTLTPNQSKQ